MTLKENFKKVCATLIAIVLTITALPASVVSAQEIADTGYPGYEVVFQEYAPGNAVYYEDISEAIIPECEESGFPENNYFDVWEIPGYDPVFDFDVDIYDLDFEIEIFEIEYVSDAIDITTLESIPLDYFLGDFSDVAIRGSGDRESLSGQYDGFVIDEIPSAISAFGATDIAPMNINNPNLAWPLMPNVPESRDSLTARGQVRWYFLEVHQRSRLTAALNMPSNVDFDLEVFRLNQSTMMLQSVGFSWQHNPEIVRVIAEPGIYFFAISSFIGTGPFVLTPHLAAGSVNNGLNHTQATATPLASDNFTVNGVICNPFDLHWYSFNLTGMRYATFTFTRPAGMNAEFFLVNGEFVYSITPGVQYRLPGVRLYIIVRGVNGWHNPNLLYTLRMTSQAPSQPQPQPQDLVIFDQNVTLSGSAFGGGTTIFRNPGLSLQIRGWVTRGGVSAPNVELVVGAFNRSAPGGDSRREITIRSDSTGGFTAIFTPNLPTSNHNGDFGELYIRTARNGGGTWLWGRDAFFAWRH